jgi:hypothetical protein
MLSGLQAAHKIFNSPEYEDIYAMEYRDITHVIMRFLLLKLAVVN